jgi:hypothetical protein
MEYFHFSFFAPFRVFRGPLPSGIERPLNTQTDAKFAVRIPGDALPQKKDSLGGAFLPFSPSFQFPDSF